MTAPNGRELVTYMVESAGMDVMWDEPDLSDGDRNTLYRYNNDLRRHVMSGAMDMDIQHPRDLLGACIAHMSKATIPEEYYAWLLPKMLERWVQRNFEPNRIVPVDSGAVLIAVGASFTYRYVPPDPTRFVDFQVSELIVPIWGLSVFQFGSDRMIEDSGVDDANGNLCSMAMFQAAAIRERYSFVGTLLLTQGTQLQMDFENIGTAPARFVGSLVGCALKKCPRYRG
jgi:hypothetical protein